MFTFGTLKTTRLIDPSSNQTQAEELESISTTLVPRMFLIIYLRSDIVETDPALVYSLARCCLGRLQPQYTSRKRCRGAQRNGNHH